MAGSIQTAGEQGSLPLLLQVILMDHVDWLDEQAASLLATRLAEQVCIAVFKALKHCMLVSRPHLCYLSPDRGDPIPFGPPLGLVMMLRETCSWDSVQLALVA